MRSSSLQSLRIKAVEVPHGCGHFIEEAVRCASGGQDFHQHFWTADLGLIPIPMPTQRQPTKVMAFIRDYISASEYFEDID